MMSTIREPAALGRLCVETLSNISCGYSYNQPPSGGCVLKQIMDNDYAGAEVPAALGRLCVETNHLHHRAKTPQPSRPRAAVC